MDQDTLVESLVEQARWCGNLGSAFYQGLLLRIADNVQSSGVCWKLLQQRDRDSLRSLLPLRFLAALHRLVLMNQLPAMAEFYPSVGGQPQVEAAWKALELQLERCGELVMENLPESVQTNEIARSCALLPGFLAIARVTGMPIRLVELGCSAGLNLRWDCYRYENSRGGWGPPDSAVRFVHPFGESAPDLSGTVSIASRTGCDINPVDPTTPEGRLTLLSFVWPDQTERFRRLLAAIEIARTTPARVERANAIEWLPAQLNGVSSGVVTVVFHSVVMLYLSRVDQQRVMDTILEAGTRARPDAPLAWLSMEKNGQEVEVQLTLWPGGVQQRIAVSDYHGTRTVVL